LSSIIDIVVLSAAKTTTRETKIPPGHLPPLDIFPPVITPDISSGVFVHRRIFKIDGQSNDV